MTGSALSPGSGGSQAILLTCCSFRSYCRCRILKGLLAGPEGGHRPSGLRTKTAQGLGGEQEGHVEAEQRCLHRSLDRDEEASLGRAEL